VKLRHLFNNRVVSFDVNPGPNRGDRARTVALQSGETLIIEICSQGIPDGNVSFDLLDPVSQTRRRYSVPVAHTERGIEISYMGRTYLFTSAGTGGDPAKRPRGSGSVIAPMVGLLSELLVAEGDVVAAYQPLAVVEAMKVMATIEAPFAGTVKRLYVAKGAQLTHGQPLIDVVPSDNSQSQNP